MVQKVIVSGCKRGDLALVKNFLAHKHAMPAADDQEALCTAIHYFRNEIAKYMLETFPEQLYPLRKAFPRKKMAIKFNSYGSPIETAVRANNREMIDYFLVHPSYASNVLTAAILNYREELAMELIDNKDKYNIHMDGDLLVDAIKANNQEIFARLMKFPEISLDNAWSYIKSYHYNMDDSWPFMAIFTDPRFVLTEESIQFCMNKCKSLEEFNEIMSKKGDFQPSVDILDNAIEK